MEQFECDECNGSGYFYITSDDGKREQRVCTCVGETDAYQQLLAQNLTMRGLLGLSKRVSSEGGELQEFVFARYRKKGLVLLAEMVRVHARSWVEAISQDDLKKREEGAGILHVPLPLIPEADRVTLGADEEKEGVEDEHF